MWILEWQVQDTRKSGICCGTDVMAELLPEEAALWISSSILKRINLVQHCVRQPAAVSELDGQRLRQ